MIENWISVQMVYPGDLDTLSMEDELQHLIEDSEIIPNDDEEEEFTEGMMTTINTNHIRQFLAVRDRPDLTSILFADGDMMFIKHDYSKVSEFL